MTGIDVEPAVEWLMDGAKGAVLAIFPVSDGGLTLDEACLQGIEAARIESHTKALGMPLLPSEEVVRHMPGDWNSLGEFALRGVGHDIEVYIEPDL